MPITILHEKIATDLTRKNKNFKNNDFFLGNIAPDAVNLKGFAPKKERWYSHIRSSNINEWKNNIKSFYLKEKNNYPKYFLLGYISHILTDILYDELYYDKVIEKVKGKDKHQEMLKDMERYISNHKDYEYLKDNLNNINNFYSIRNISKKDLKEFTKIIKDKNYDKESPKYFNEKLVSNLVNDVYKELMKYEEM